MTEKTQTGRIICGGGLNSSENWVNLSDNYPGFATMLVNFEPSLYGGYRRINGYIPLESSNAEVDPDNAEGQILGLILYRDSIIAARKQKDKNEYCLYRWRPNDSWEKINTGFPLEAIGVAKLRYITFNFTGVEQLVVVDGVNYAYLFNGTDWTQLKSSNDGATFAKAGGNQLLDKPKYVTLYKNHIFLSGDSDYPHVVCHSAPLDPIVWTAAAGAGQIIAGFPVVQIKPFRDSNFVFGVNAIKRIDVAGTTFVINDVTSNLGCLASDSVVEVNGDLIFLSQDGFRPVSATERLQDIELASISKLIQEKVRTTFNFYDLDATDVVVLRKKSQVRFFNSLSSTSEDIAKGFIAGLVGGSEGQSWEWSELQGIKASCAASGYVNHAEVILHGGYDGVVYRQEIGNTFNGKAIYSLYATPYLDFEDPLIRKTFRSMRIFIKPEGGFNMKTGISYDWGASHTVNPRDYAFMNTSDVAFWDEAKFDQVVFDGAVFPILMKNIQGSGFSVRFIFMTNEVSSPFSIQSILLGISYNERE